jgi:hypothetical protein
MDSLHKFIDWYDKQISSGQWQMKDSHDFDYIRISLSLAQMAWLAAIQLLLQTLSMGYMYLFYRINQRLKKIRGNDQMCLDYITRKEKERKRFIMILGLMVPIEMTLVMTGERMWIPIALGVPLGLYWILLQYQKYAVKKYLNHDL